jgi:hypothetical protein
MEVKNILIFVILLILLIIIIRYLRRDVNKLSNLENAKIMQEITPSELTDPEHAGSSNFTYSIWFYIDNWNYRYGEEKVLFGRMISGTGATEPCPSVVFGEMQNNLKVLLTVYPGLEDNTLSNNFIVYNCSIQNMPIQKWTNLLVTVYGRFMDVYLDGKLVRTCLLPGVSKIDPNAPVYITPNGGFSGWTSKFQYWSHATDPQEAWNIYKKGYGASIFGNLFGQYSIKNIIFGSVCD